MIARRLFSAAGITAAAWLVIACADKVAGPRPEIIVSFSISEEQRAALSAALAFVSRPESVNALADREGAARIGAALAGLADRVARNDRRGARLSLDAARSALAAYRERAPVDVAGLLEIETMSLALEHVALLISDSPALTLYGIDPVER